MKFFSHKKIGVDYLDRWHVLPRNPFFNVMIHRFTGDDKSEELHDHPWPFLSILLRGSLIEDFRKPSGMIASHIIPRFVPRFYRAEHRHRIEVLKGPAWTVVFIGPRVRLWGFYSRSGVMTKLLDDENVVIEFPENKNARY